MSRAIVEKIVFLHPWGGIVVSPSRAVHSVLLCIAVVGAAVVRLHAQGAHRRGQGEVFVNGGGGRARIIAFILS
jgi:hypothetical protein